MNKKIIFVMLAILLGINSFVWLSQSNFQSDARKTESAAKLSAQHYKSFVIPDTVTSQATYSQILNALNKAGKATHSNYLKKQIFYGWQVSHHKLNYSRPVKQITFQVSQIKPTMVWNNINHPAQKVTQTSYTTKQNSLGFKVTIEPIMHNSSQQQHEGNFYLESNSPTTYTRFLRLCSRYLNQTTQQHTTFANFIPTKNYETVPLEIDAPNLSTYKSITLLFIIVFTIILLLNSSETIANYRLNGFSIAKILIRCFGSVIGITVALLIAEIIFLLLIGWPIGVTTLAGMSSGLIFALLSAWLTIWGLVHFSLTNQIRRRNYNRWTFITLYLFKACFIIYLFVGFIPLLQVATNSYNVLRDNSVKTTLGNKYAVFYPHVNGYNLSNSNIKLSDLQRLDKTMYTTMNNRGSILFNDDYIHQQIENAYKYLVVNPNYLNHYPLYSTTHQRIKVSNNTSTIWILIPSTQSSQTRKIIAGIKDSERGNSKNSPTVKQIYYPANQKIVDLTQRNYIKAWPILVSTQQNTPVIERSIMNGQGARDNLKVPVRSNLIATYQSIRPSLMKYSYADNYPQLVKLNDLPLEDLKMDIGNLQQNALTLILSALVTFFLTAYITLLYFKVNRNVLTTKRVNGYSLIKTYRSLFAMLGLQTAVMSYLTIFQYQNNLYYWLLTMIITIFELAAAILIIRRTEHQNMKELLNDK